MASGRIDDFLCRYFDKEQIFRDIRQIGIDSRFSDRINEALKQSKVLILVIGKTWLTVADEYGRRRIDKDNDWVRKEFTISIELEKTIIPILLEDAPMPLKDSLPLDLQEITEYEALRIRDETFVTDMLILTKYLENENLNSSEKIQIWKKSEKW